MSELACITTTEGEMVIEFWPDVAPEHGREFQEARQPGLLRRHLFSSRHQGFHDPRRRPADQGRLPRKLSGARAARATRSRPSSTTARTSAASFPWRAPTIPIPPAASFSSATATRVSRPSIHRVRQTDQRRRRAGKNRHHADASAGPARQTHGRHQHQDCSGRRGEMICMEFSVSGSRA